MKANQQKILALERTVQRLEETGSFFEDTRSRKNNLVVFGIAEGAKETREALENLVIRRVLHTDVNSVQTRSARSQERKGCPSPPPTLFLNFGEGWKGGGDSPAAALALPAPIDMLQAHRVQD